MRNSPTLLTSAMALACAALAGRTSLAAEPAAPKATAATPAAASFYDFEVETIDGVRTNLAPYRGQAVLVVNVASKCGFTKQYAGLQQLHETYGKRGLAVIGFPSNDFLGQEPGSSAEIKSFCTLTFGVTFPLYAKIRVKGKDRHPLYAWLTDKAQNPQTSDVSWNFNKYLVSRDGRLLAHFGSRTAPDAAELTDAIEKALAP
jgi:glutathione peroxidase